MFALIFYEIRKFFSIRKNRIGIILYVLFLFIYVALNIRAQRMRSQSELAACLLNIQNIQTYINQKNQPAELQKERNETLSYYQKEENAIETGNWREKLRIQVKMDEGDLTLTRAGKLHGEDVTALQNRIETNRILLQKGIQPMIPDVSMTSYNFIRLAFKNGMPVLMLILLLLLSSDALSREADDGSIRLLFTQPVEKWKIYMAKYLAYSVLSVLIVFAVCGAFFLVLGFTEGFSSPDYPVEVGRGAFNSIFFGSVTSSGTELIGIGRLILLMIPLVVLAIFCVTAISLFLSALFSSAAASMAISILLSATAYIFIFTLRVFQPVTYLLPLSYINAASVLDGSDAHLLNDPCLTYPNGFVILFVWLILCFAAGLVVFQRKEYAG